MGGVHRLLGRVIARDDDFRPGGVLFPPVRPPLHGLLLDIEIRDRDFGAGGGCTRRERAGKRRLTDTTLLRHESDDQ